MKIEPPFSASCLGRIGDVVKKAVEADDVFASCYLAELRLVWIGVVIAGDCDRWFVTPAADREGAERVALHWCAVISMAMGDLNDRAAQAAAQLIKNMH